MARASNKIVNYVAAEMLGAAHKLIGRRSRWTRDAYARDVRGDECLSTGDDTVRWCARGAVGFARSKFTEVGIQSDIVERATRKAEAEINLQARSIAPGVGGYVGLNDGFGRRKVCYRLVKRAMRQARAALLSAT